MNGPYYKPALALLIFFLPGCRDEPLEPIILDVTGVKPEVNYSDLASVLEDAVNSKGMIDGDVLANHQKYLEAQIRRLAVTGPTVTAELLPTSEDRLAYWYNARAAWSLKLLLLRKCPKALNRAELLDREFPIDGRKMTLTRIDAILAADADWRTLVSAPGVCLDRARLPAAPFRGEDIRARIAERFVELVDDPRRFVIDVENQRILIPAVLWRFRGRLIEQYDTSYGTVGATLNQALLPHVQGSALRRLQDAVGYAAVQSPSTGVAALVD